MAADVCINVVTLAVLILLRVIFEVYNEPISITDLPSRTVKEAIRSATDHKCPFFLYDGSKDCSFSDVSESFLATKYGVPINVLRRVEAYSSKHSIANYLSDLNNQLGKIGIVLDAIANNGGIWLHCLLALIGKQIVLAVLGAKNEVSPSLGGFMQFFFRTSYVDRLLVIVMTSFAANDDRSLEPDSDLLDALVVWTLLTIVFEQLANKAVEHLNSVTILERTKEKQRNPSTDLRIIAVAFSCLLLSIIMLASSTFAFTVSPFFGIRMFLYTLSLHSRWVFIFTWVLMRTFKDVECEEARNWLHVFRIRTLFIADLSQFLYWSFLTVSFTVIDEQFLALFFVSRCTKIASKLHNPRSTYGRLEGLS